MKTLIKSATWESKMKFLGKKSKPMVIFTNVFAQGDTIIDCNSTFLFEMVCLDFWKQNPDVKINVELNKVTGSVFADAYLMIVYNKIYTYLFKEEIKNDITSEMYEGNAFMESRMFMHSKEHLGRLLRIIKHLKTNFKKHGDNSSRLTFKTKGKKNLKIEDSKGI